jgi:hypothetical protein
VTFQFGRGLDPRGTQQDKIAGRKCIRVRKRAHGDVLRRPWTQAADGA